ncbi:MAG: Coenzyme F420 hydrogenase/dehydrogenase, beta subunit C-terminal domain [Methanobacteriaceae archaeon]|nr:Coenzyme F420 hydrogenase/dehydrogenase, beta subunit C-terminal domain [Methanobacteriaceae archaeon]
MDNEYLLAKAKNEQLHESGECGGAVSSIFKYLLDEKIVDGVLVLTKGEDLYDGIPTFIENSDEIINSCGSLHCSPTLYGDLLSKELKDKKVAISVKPCDMMAIKELEIRHQINPENIITVGLNCGGTVKPVTAEKMIKLFYDTDPQDVVKEEIDKGKFIIELKDGTEKSVKIDDLEDEGYGRRENCRRCVNKIPRQADLACGNWGSANGWTFVEVTSQKGKEIIENAENKGYVETKTPGEKPIAIRSKIEKVMIKMGNKFQKRYLEKEYPSINQWDNYWNRCIECYSCRDICPICYCIGCELERDFYKDDSTTRNPLTFQAVRISHMAYSCINCGQCEDVCPMEIPIARIYQRMQNKYKEISGYEAGHSDELPPIYSPLKE